MSSGLCRQPWGRVHSRLQSVKMVALHSVRIFLLVAPNPEQQRRGDSGKQFKITKVTPYKDATGSRALTP